MKLKKKKPTGGNADTLEDTKKYFTRNESFDGTGISLVLWVSDDGGQISYSEGDSKEDEDDSIATSSSVLQSLSDFYTDIKSRRLHYVATYNTIKI